MAQLEKAIVVLHSLAKGLVAEDEHANSTSENVPLLI